MSKIVFNKLNNYILIFKFFILFFPYNSSFKIINKIINLLKIIEQNVKQTKKNNLIYLKINKLKTKKNQSIPKPKISQLETKSTASFNKFLLGNSGNSILLKQV